MAEDNLLMVNITKKMTKDCLLKLSRQLQNNLKSISQDVDRSTSTGIKELDAVSSLDEVIPSPKLTPIFNNSNINVNDSLFKRIDELEDRILDTEKRLYDAEVTINKTDQYIRRENLEIAGIPQSVEQEHLEKYVLDLLSAIDVNTDSYHVVGCHRFAKKRNQDPPNVIIRFTNRKIAYDALLNKYKLGNDEVKEKLELQNNIYISENLTPANDDIFKACRRLKKFNKIQKVITRNGHIKILQNNSNRYQTLYHMNDIYFYVDEVDNILNNNYFAS